MKTKGHQVLVQEQYANIFFSLAKGLLARITEIVSSLAAFTSFIPSTREIIELGKIILTEQCRLARIKAVFELSFVLSDDKYIAKLNQSYRNKEGATDVLSFPLLTKPASASNLGGIPLLLGDIVISAPSCVRQALAPVIKSRYRAFALRQRTRTRAVLNRTEKKNLVLAEFKRLYIHGILHLFAYDHEISRKEELRMKQREKLLYQLVNKKLSLLK